MEVNIGEIIVDEEVEIGELELDVLKYDSGGGTNNYLDLNNLPRINGVKLVGNKTTKDLRIQAENEVYIGTEEPTDPDVEVWINPDGEPVVIPTKLSELENDSGFIIEDEVNELIPTKTSELTNDSNFAKTNENNNFTCSQTINGTLTINGDIVQNGESYETHAEQVYTKNDEIITRDGATGGLSNGVLTGIRAKKYDGTNDGQLGFDNSGTARVGDVNDTQPLLTRDEISNLTTGQVLVWDGIKLRAVGSSEYLKSSELDNRLKTIDGYNSSKTQFLKNTNGLLNWAELPIYNGEVE